MEWLKEFLSGLTGMGLCDLLAVFFFLFIVKLEIKIVLKIVGALILLEVALMVYHSLTGDGASAEAFMIAVGYGL